ncbi:MAG: hypothetical protein IPJ18_01330 [Betaproteobacteria bacterium]|nr:hypothetical protein [Betaproteobacteria bacterium]
MLEPAAPVLSVANSMNAKRVGTVTLGATRLAFAERVVDGDCGVAQIWIAIITKL